MSPADRSRMLPADAPDVLDEVRRGFHVDDEVMALFERACRNDPAAHPGTLGVDTWLFDPLGTHVLLVDHPVRGWVAPGGKPDAGEHPRAAAARELQEETGVVVAAERLRPAAAHARESPGGYSVSYWATASMDVALTAEPLMRGLRWWPLDAHWQSIYRHDRERISTFAAAIRSGAAQAEI